MYAGAFASRNPRTSLAARGGFFKASAPDGLYMARFGWADPTTGYAHSARVVGAALGFVAPVAGFRRQLVRDGIVIRPGYPVTLFKAGDFFARFAAGAQVGQRVYASIVDGSAISGNDGVAESTPWFITQGCGPGGLAIISTWSNFR